MKVTTALISAAAATAITAGGMLIASTPNDVAIKPSPGVTGEQLVGVEPGFELVAAQGQYSPNRKTASRKFTPRKPVPRKH